jgi:hypothetical protein
MSENSSNSESNISTQEKNDDDSTISLQQNETDKIFKKLESLEKASKPSIDAIKRSQFKSSHRKLINNNQILPILNTKNGL